MKTKRPKYLAPAALAVLLPSAMAADSPYAPVPENRVFLNGRLGLNIGVRFADLAARPASAADPGPNINGVPRTYDNGFVGVDSSGNAGGRTWYWGYQDAAQYDPAFGTLTYQATVNTGNDLTHTEDADPQGGFSLGYTRSLGHTGRVSWGVSLIGGWMAIDARDAVSVSSQEGTITDLYTLGSVVPPTAPYSGTVNGPGPAIPDRPTYRVSAVDPVDRSINRKLNGDIWNLQLGPTARIDLCRHAACTLGAGVSLALLDAKLSYAGTTTDPTGTTTVAGSRSDSTGAVGAYVRAEVAAFLGRGWDVFAGAQWQYFDDLSLSHGPTRAEVELKDGIEVLLGVGYSF
ncbi:MAG: hypothetical protein D6766_10090 [Verrucomicrobia bacterium]|nr:MAG: hypothetical protein D6766_10090 [Verrucomicrobiota bacterium]